MKTEVNYVCPRCEYPLVPVHAVEGSRRKVIALSCPEPYCDHMQMVPRRRAVDLMGRNLPGCPIQKAN